MSRKVIIYRGYQLMNRHSLGQVLRIKNVLPGNTVLTGDGLLYLSIRMTAQVKHLIALSLNNLRLMLTQKGSNHQLL